MKQSVDNAVSDKSVSQFSIVRSSRVASQFNELTPTLNLHIIPAHLPEGGGRRLRDACKLNRKYRIRPSNREAGDRSEVSHKPPADNTSVVGADRSIVDR